MGIWHSLGPYVAFNASRVGAGSVAEEAEADFLGGTVLIPWQTWKAERGGQVSQG